MTDFHLCLSSFVYLRSPLQGMQLCKQACIHTYIQREGERKRKRKRKRAPVTDAIQIFQENYILFSFANSVNACTLINRAAVSNSPLIPNVVNQCLFFSHWGRVTHSLPFVRSLTRGRETQPPNCQC